MINLKLPEGNYKGILLNVEHGSYLDANRNNIPTTIFTVQVEGVGNPIKGIFSHSTPDTYMVQAYEDLGGQALAAGVYAPEEEQIITWAKANTFDFNVAQSTKSPRVQFWNYYKKPEEKKTQRPDDVPVTGGIA
jgi:hypothetical protein